MEEGVKSGGVLADDVGLSAPLPYGLESLWGDSSAVELADDDLGTELGEPAVVAFTASAFVVGGEANLDFGVVGE